jgi:hypothetical protein
MPSPFAGVHVRGGTIAALLTLAPLLSARPARACSCVQEFTRRTVEQAAAVFAGTVRTIDYLEPDAPTIEPKILVTFDVSEIWKGPTQRTLRLRTTYNKSSCSGYIFQEGASYFVTAFGGSAPSPDGAVELEDVNVCGTTTPLGRAGDLVKVLGRPGWKPPTKVATP